MYGDNYGFYYAYIFINPTIINPTIITGVFRGGGEGREFPNATQLLQNYPNPFNPNTNIEYQLSKRGSVEISIYDNNGRLVKTLLNTEQYPGNYTIQWDGKNDAGATVASGTYFYQVKSDNVQLVKKMLLLK
jgi:WD40 repeat protein